VKPVLPATARSMIFQLQGVALPRETAGWRLLTVGRRGEKNAANRSPSPGHGAEDVQRARTLGEDAGRRARIRRHPREPHQPEQRLRSLIALNDEAQFESELS
jgi:hypothetical protein